VDQAPTVLPIDSTLELERHIDFAEQIDGTYETRAPIPLLPRPTQHAEIPRVMTAFEVTLPRHVDRPAPPNSRSNSAASVEASILHALVQTLPRHPALHCRWDAQSVIRYRRLRLGISFDGRHVHGVLEDALDWNVRGLARRIMVLRDSPVQARDATFVVSLSAGGAEWREPTVDTSCGAMVSIGTPRDLPVVVAGDEGDMIVVRRRVLLVLAYDARCLTQPEADRFLQDLRDAVERRAPLMLD